MKDESKEPEAIDGAVRVAHLVKHASFLSRIASCQLIINILKRSFVPLAPPVKTEKIWSTRLLKLSWLDSD